MVETIVAAAIRREGVVFSGAHHHHIIHYVSKCLNIRPVTGEQGFLTSLNRYVDRIEAGKIAIAAGQITKLTYHHEELFSEELWRVPQPYPNVPTE